MSTTQEVGMTALEHFGVKGMHWGVRKRDERTATMLTARRAEEAKRAKKLPVSPVQTHATVGKNRFAKTKIETHGGENHPATPDALKVAVVRQKYKKSGVHALTNQEMRDLTQRMNLEKQVRDLEGSSSSIGSRVVSALIDSQTGGSGGNKRR